MNGIDVAIVEDIEKDTKLNYITVKVEGTGVKIKNVQVMTPIAGVGPKDKPAYGMVFVPPIGQRVVIGYLDQQKRFAICLGCLYDETNRVPFNANKTKPNLYFQYGEEWFFRIDKTKKTMEFKMGAKGKEDIISVDQTSKKISFQLSDKQTKITIDGKKGSIDVKAKTEIKLAVGQNNLQINSQGINLKATGNLNVKGLNTVLQAQAQAKLQGATAVVKGTASTMLG